MHLIGRNGHQREGYPRGPGAATSALRNRNVAGDTNLTAPFTPNSSTIALLIFTPRVSGVLQASVSVDVQNGATSETYELGLFIFTGTGFAPLSGGETTANGWVMGSNTPPVTPGTPGAPVLVLADFVTLGSGAVGTLDAFGISTPPLPLGVPVLVAVEIAEVGGGNPLAEIAIANLSVMELP